MTAGLSGTRPAVASRWLKRCASGSSSVCGTPGGQCAKCRVSWGMAKSCEGWVSDQCHDGFADDLGLALLVDALHLDAQERLAVLLEALGDTAGAMRRVVEMRDAPEAHVQRARQ